MSPRRVACVCVPEVRLQVLLRDRPMWRSLPVAVVEEDRPDAFLVALNGRARREGLDASMRQGVARSLVPTLRAAVVTDARVREATRDLAEALRALSPRVEPDDAGSGVFTVDPSGMGSLHRDARAWALAARRAVGAHGFVCSVAVGFDRRAAHAIAHCARRVVVARTVDEERALAADVPLAALGLHAREVQTLAALGLRTLGDLWSLPPDTVRHRFGPAVAELRAWITDDARVPVQPEVPREALRTVVELEAPDDDLPRLLFGLRGALHLLAARLAGRGEAIAALTLTLSLEDHTRVEHRVESASPTRDVALLVELARLRLSEAALPARVAEMEVLAEPAALRGEQLNLFAHDRARDRNAASRAMARVRAAFGERSVTRARLREAHLPEGRFAWEPVAAPPARAVGVMTAAEGDGALVRRLVVPPREIAPEALRALSPMPPVDVLPWLRAGAVNDPPVVGAVAVDAWTLATPSRVSGGWWAREVERDYYYAEGDGGELLWVFYDGVRRRWFVQGVVD